MKNYKGNLFKETVSPFLHKTITDKSRELNKIKAKQPDLLTSQSYFLKSMNMGSSLKEQLDMQKTF